MSSSSSMRAGHLALTLVLIAASAFAQRPGREEITSSMLSSPGGTTLDFAWLYAPGDGPGREAPAFDDSRWLPVRPGLEEGKLPPSWPDAGWFRCHLLIVDSSLDGQTVAMRMQSPGTASVYFDGQLLMSSGGPRPEFASERRDATLVTLRRGAHVLAVRYAIPSKTRVRGGAAGFRLSIADPALAAQLPSTQPWTVALRGAAVALPFFLVFLHLGLFAFDRRARENFFFAVEMAAWGLLVVNEYRSVLFPVRYDVIKRIAPGMPIIVIFFALLTYYAVRVVELPKTWRHFAAAAGVLLAVSYVSPADLQELPWAVYFLATCVVVIRVERSGRTVKRKGSKWFFISLAVLAVAIFLQILSHIGLGFRNGVHQWQVRLPPDVLPWHGSPEVFGSLVAAVGMSLYLARTVGERRVAEIENQRKTEELARARELQLSMLPPSMPKVAGLDVAVATQTAAEVGGDYYDVRVAGDDALLVAFGDATGHGLAAGIVVTAAKALFSSLPPGGSLAAQLADCDRAMRAMQLPALRMCLTLARVSSRELIVTSAAMPPVLIHRPAIGTVDEIGNGSLPLGSRLRGQYEEQRTALSAGDTILFATDGFAETVGEEQRQFGYERAAGALRDAAGAASAAAVIDELVAAASRFRGARPQDDDMTFLVVRVGTP